MRAKERNEGGGGGGGEIQFPLPFFFAPAFRLETLATQASGL